MRPKTLAEVARLSLSGDSFDRCLANFLAEFYPCPERGAIEEQRALLAPVLGKLGRVQDAYLASVAEEFANKFSLPVPPWTSSGTRALHEPWFASPLASLRGVLGTRPT